ncbi:hypothetical protein VTI74DRAFT_10339 [Chaetomium olivicolor]
MAELISLVASIIQVASFGLSLSRTLHDYGSSVIGAEKRLKGLDKDIEFTSRVISQLGNRLQDTQVQALVSEDTIRLTQDAVAECEAIFRAMEDVIAKIRSSGNMARWTLYFRDSKIELLRSNLDRMKGNLNLLIGVIIHGTQMATEHPDQASITAHRAKIRELMIEKEQYTQKYLEEKRKYDQLLEKINSTSTLGSIILLTTSSETQALAGQASLAVNKTSDIADAEEQAGTSTNESRANQGSPPPTYTAVSHTPLLPINAPTLASASPVASEALTAVNRSTSAPQPKLSSTSLRGPSISSEESLSAAAARTSPPFAVVSEPLKTLERPKKRVTVAKRAKKTAKGAGITVSVIIGAALFPITIPIFLIIRHRRKRRLASQVHLPHPDLGQLQPLPQLHGNTAVPHVLEMHYQPQMTTAQQPSYIAQMPASFFPAAQSRADFDPRASIASNYYTAGGMSYDSSRLPAELPAVHELSKEEPALALVGRLMRVDGYHGVR